MPIVHEKTPAESVAPPMKDAKILLLMDELGALQQKGLENAQAQHDLTAQILAGLKEAHDVRQKSVETKTDVGGEG